MCIVDEQRLGPEAYGDIIAFMIWNNGEKHGCVALLRLDTLSARAARRAGVHGRQHNAEDY